MLERWYEQASRREWKQEKWHFQDWMVVKYQE
jgi:hypothetical protein